ncbi:unnamed protein product [Callosobruchus maculatus]|uniref:Uncharacterized protein n=1 Tax=Callosobruchus maculatus TaxID=64391 RepID=A0A653DXF8_CALMS|nr:unnamed protein product [Callosobruchus maculatus]
MTKEEETCRKKRSSRSKSPTEKNSKRAKQKDRKKRSRSRSRESKRYRKSSDDAPREYPRYYGEDRQNSDSYWNKYPKKVTKEPVGPDTMTVLLKNEIEIQLWPVTCLLWLDIVGVKLGAIKI